jgi:hypothetical protein
MYMGLFSVGAFWISDDPAMPQVHFGYLQPSNGTGGTSGGVSDVNLMDIEDLAEEKFVLTIDVDRTVTPAVAFKFDFRSANIVFIDNYEILSGENIYTETIVPTFTFRTGDRMLPIPEALMSTPYVNGMSNITVTKFYCEDLA